MPWSRDGYWSAQPEELADYADTWRVASGGQSSRGPGWVEVLRADSPVRTWYYSEREASWYATGGPRVEIPSAVMARVAELTR